MKSPTTDVAKWAKTHLGYAEPSLRTAIMLGTSPRGIKMAAGVRECVLAMACWQLFPKERYRSQYPHFDGVVRPSCLVKGCNVQNPLDAKCFGPHGFDVTAILEHENSQEKLTYHLAWFAQFRAPFKLLVMPDSSGYATFNALQRSDKAELNQFKFPPWVRDEAWYVAIYEWHPLKEWLSTGAEPKRSIWDVRRVT